MIANEIILCKRPQNTEINNYRSPPHRIVSYMYKRPRKYACKIIQTKKTSGLIYNVQKINEKQICNTSENNNHWITDSRLGTGTYIQNVAGLNMLAGSQTFP